MNGQLRVVSGGDVMLFSPFEFMFKDQTAGGHRIRTDLFRPPSVYVTRLSPSVRVDSVLFRQGFHYLWLNLLFLRFFRLTCRLRSFNFYRSTYQDGDRLFHLKVRILTVTSHYACLFPFNRRDL